MATNDDPALDLRDNEGLPWLEPAGSYDDEDDDFIAPGKLIAIVLAGLVAIGAVLGGLWWFQGGRDRGQGELIAAQDGEYKVAPKDDGARRFEGEGDAILVASEGQAPAGQVDPSRLPEEPVTPVKAADADTVTKAAPVPAPAPTTAGSAPAAAAAAPKGGATPADKVAAKAPVVVSKAPAPAPAKAAPAVKAAPAPAKAAATTGTSAAPASGGGATIQLGAFSSQESAQQAWTSLTRRFAYLQPLSRDIVRAEVGGGTVYRLRAGAGSTGAANDVCGKLRVAGESCVIVR